ncbi:MAG TPA: hypothetical protein P5525_26000, partial [Candidatus Paceibacterota bacterium]|nr:hypothetical protein [Candidatus Paceibacterota bacterium]
CYPGNCAAQYYVQGTDICPDGRTWLEVYQSIRPNRASGGEVTDILASGSPLKTAFPDWENKRTSRFCVKTLLPVEGDWFCVKYFYESPRSRCFIERVVLWAQIDTDEEVDHVEGIDCSGLPFQWQPSLHEFFDMYYVLGADLSPDGRTWSEAYRAAKPDHSLTRELTDAFGPVLKR